MTKAARKRELDAAYVMVEQGCNPYIQPNGGWMSREHAILRGLVARDRRLAYKRGEI